MWVASVVCVGGVLDGVSQILAWVLSVVWVQKILAQAKKMVGVEILVRVNSYDSMNFYFDF